MRSRSHVVVATSCFRCWGIGCYFCPGAGADRYEEAARVLRAEYPKIARTVDGTGLPPRNLRAAYKTARDDAADDARLLGLLRIMEGCFDHAGLSDERGSVAFLLTWGDGRADVVVYAVDEQSAIYGHAAWLQGFGCPGGYTDWTYAKTATRLPSVGHLWAL
jgi:hypothetical protein